MIPGVALGRISSPATDEGKMIKETKRKERDVKKDKEKKEQHVETVRCYYKIIGQQ